jgi:hypothetical protein
MEFSTYTGFYVYQFSVHKNLLLPPEQPEHFFGRRRSPYYATTVGAASVVITPIAAELPTCFNRCAPVQKLGQRIRFIGTLMSRLNDKRAGAIFVVTQRLHQEDLTGMLIEKGWDGLVLPAIAPRDTVIKIGADLIG